MTAETAPSKPATEIDPQLKQPEKSHMHSKDAQLKGDTARQDAAGTKKPD